MPFAIPDKDRAQAFAIPEQDRDQAATPQRQERGFFGNLLPTPEGREFLAESATAVPGFATDFAHDKARAVKTYWQNIARMAGLDVPEPTPEEQAHFRAQLVEGLATMAGGGAGAGISRGGQGIARGFMRGGTRRGMDRWLKDQAQHVVTEGSRPLSRLLPNLVRPVTVGVGTEIAVDWTNPTTSEFWDQLVSITAGIGAGGAAGTEARANLLLEHPKFRAAAIKASRAGLPAKVIGGLTGYLLAQLYPEDEQ